MFSFLIHLLIHFVWFVLFLEINNKTIPQFRSRAIILTWTRYTVNYFSSLFFRISVVRFNGAIKKENKHETHTSTDMEIIVSFGRIGTNQTICVRSFLIWFSLLFVVEIDKLCNGTEIGHFAERMESEKKRKKWKKSVRKFSTFHGFFALSFCLQNSRNFLHSFHLFIVWCSCIPLTR